MSGNSTTILNAQDFRQLVLAGTRCLEANVEAINSLNVFPVPDGDTGINMLLTLRAANSSEEIPEDSLATVAVMSSAIARGALLGARGNSGVIFSQFMKGLAAGLTGFDTCDGPLLAAAITRASDAGYQAVGTPVEGTMLTVMSAAGEAVKQTRGNPAEVLRTAYEAAQRALARTPEQLAVLKEAGVVDAGGQGVVAFLAGALGFASGEDIPFSVTARAGGAGGTSDSLVSHDFLEHTEEEMYGYCSQFVVEGEALDADGIRRQVMKIANSTVVVGDDRVIRVHAHAEDPGPLLSLGASIGRLDQISIQNMDLQHQQFMARHGYTRAEKPPFAIVAVVPSPGLKQVFLDLGAATVVEGGQTMNPSTSDILDAAGRANGLCTLVLPNNKNIILAAEQAAGLVDGSITVVPSTTIPEGIAALLASNPDLSNDENIAAMNHALSTVQSGEVTVAVRSTNSDGIEIAQGQAIAILDGRVTATAENPNSALLKMLVFADPEEDSLVTLYYGADLDRATAEAASVEIQTRFTGVEVELIEGGQPHYHYIVSIE